MIWPDPNHPAYQEAMQITYGVLGAIGFAFIGLFLVLGIVAILIFIAGYIGGLRR